MNLDEFWSIVDRVHFASGGDMDSKCNLLAEELRKLSVEELLSFDRHFCDCFRRAYNDDLWGAAFVIKDGCGEDLFMDFRSTLISLGRKAFEVALADPDSLAALDIKREWATYQGYQHVACKIYSEKTSSDEMPRYEQHPQELDGRPFEEWAMSQRYPKLVAKFGYKDSDWLFIKEERDKLEQRERRVARISNIVLDAEIIPSNGRIPPMKVLANVLRSGSAPNPNSHTARWDPIELQEEDYWATVLHLEGLPSEKLKDWPYVTAPKLQQDLVTPEGTGYEQWLQSLKHRGLL